MARFNTWSSRFTPGAKILNVGGRGFSGKSEIYEVREKRLSACEVTCMDLADDPAVDIVADVHDIPQGLNEQFDGVMSFFMLEHIRDPRLAVQNMARCLKPGGTLYIETNCSFPLHWYPSDFYRFSDQAMADLATSAGLSIGHVELYDKARLTPLSEDSVLQESVEVHTCVCLIASKGPYRMRIGLDLDGCLYSHPGFFAALIESMAAQGHEFFCTSSHARSEWPDDEIRLQSLGINSSLISPDMMYDERHGELAKKGVQADRLDIVFDDDGRVQSHTQTPVICPPVDGAYSFQDFR